MAFAIVSKLQDNNSIDTSLVITSLSILGLIDMPLGQLVGAIPQGYAALGCFQRIQAFLLLESYSEKRHIATESRSTSTAKDICVSEDALSSRDIELETLPDALTSKQKENTVAIQGGMFGWSVSRPPTLNNVHVHIPHDSLLAILTGCVGCGKSTLLRGILGETTIFKGRIAVRHRDIGYCDQTPWITNASVRENVMGESAFNNSWYNEVLHACVLVSFSDYQSEIPS